MAKTILLVLGALLVQAIDGQSDNAQLCSDKLLGCPVPTNSMGETLKLNSACQYVINPPAQVNYVFCLPSTAPHHIVLNGENYSDLVSCSYCFVTTSSNKYKLTVHSTDTYDNGNNKRCPVGADILTFSGGATNPGSPEGTMCGNEYKDVGINAACDKDTHVQTPLCVTWKPTIDGNTGKGWCMKVQSNPGTC